MTDIRDFYRDKYKGSLFVIKAGGRVITDEDSRMSLLDNIQDLTDAGIKILLVYGGGHAIDDALAKADITPRKKDGRRITTRDAIPHIQNVMAGDLSFRLSTSMKKLDLAGLTLSCIPPHWINIETRPRENEDEKGFDGIITQVNKDAIDALFKNENFVATPCTGVSDKNAVNINADNVAVALAEGLQSRKLIFLSDVDGVLDKEGKLIPLITDEEIPTLIENGTVDGGMKVKLENCLHALQKGVRRIHLINGFKKDALAFEIYDAIGPGTMILNAVDQERYEEEIEKQKSIEEKRTA